jgi:tetratricopeptide (TPR) repeat protein/transcriptional regulator with XRE-family HTH domain
MEFGELLKQLRKNARWTQDHLGRLIQRDSRTIRSWENAGKLPQSSDADRLAELFELTGREYARFMSLAQGRDPGEAQPAIPAATKTLPRDIDSFTGREAELSMLASATADAPDAGGVPRICVVHGMPGVGKTKLAIHFAHMVAENYPGGQFFVDLYGHSAQRRPIHPRDELGALLLAAGIPRPQIPDELDERANAWRHWTAEHKVLLLLDDAKDADQVMPLLPGTARNLVLITTRHWLAALPDATDVPVEPMPDEDAARLFAEVANRPGIEPGSPGVTDLVGVFGGMPIVITALAAQLKQHRTWSPSYLRDSIRRKGGTLEARISDRDKVRDALSLSYQNLSAPLRRLFRYLALHPGPDVDAYAAAALVDASPATVRDQLDDLHAYHLIDELRPERYKFHALIRDYALERVAEDLPADRDAAERRLLTYFLHMARTANSFLARRAPIGVPDDIGLPPAYSPDLGSRDDAYCWLDDNRNDLDAAAQYADAHGYREYATLIPAFMDEYLVRRGHWDQASHLHQLALSAAGDNDVPARARALFGLGGIQYLRGDPAGAAVHLREALVLFGELGDGLGRAYTLKTLGATSVATGDYEAAAGMFTDALELFRQAGDRRAEADTLGHLGVLQYETGEIAAAFGSQSAARDACAELDDPVGHADALCYMGEIHRERGNFDEAIQCITDAMPLYGGDEWNVAGARYFLGATLRAAGRHAEARAQLAAALNAYREAGDKFDEAGVLNQIGLLQAALGQHDDAAANLNEALNLYISYGSPNGTLEVLNSLGELALATGIIAEAESYHRKALDIALEKKVPREEARAREGIGHALRQAGQPAEAAKFYRAARDLYEKLESPSAARLKEQGLA